MTTVADQVRGYGPAAPVAIFQWKREFETCLQLYRICAPQRVLEIGTYHGGTLYHWLQNADYGATVVSVDSYAAGVDNRHLYGEWVPDGVSLEVLAGDSRDPLVIEAVRQHGPYDWVFIDAGHYLHEVRADWENYGPMCRKGGVVLFHDILPPTHNHPEIEVAFLWAELRSSHRTLDIIWDVQADWGGIGVVLV